MSFLSDEGTRDFNKFNDSKIINVKQLKKVSCCSEDQPPGPDDPVPVVNPFPSTLIVDDLETGDIFSLNQTITDVETDLQKINNLQPSTLDNTNITGNVTLLGTSGGEFSTLTTQRVSNVAVGALIDILPDDSIDIVAAEVRINGQVINNEDLEPRVEALEVRTQNISADANVTSIGGDVLTIDNGIGAGQITASSIMEFVEGATMSGSIIQSLGNPVNAQDATNKVYVDTSQGVQDTRLGIIETNIEPITALNAFDITLAGDLNMDSASVFNTGVVNVQSEIATPIVILESHQQNSGPPDPTSSFLYNNSDNNNKLTLLTKPAGLNISKVILNESGGENIDTTLTTSQTAFTQDQEIITKKYVDDEIAGIPTGNPFDQDLNIGDNVVFGNVEVDDELVFSYSSTDKFTIEKLLAPQGLRGIDIFHRIDAGLPGETRVEIAQFKEDEVRIPPKLKLGFDGSVDITFPTVRGNNNDVLISDANGLLSWGQNNPFNQDLNTSNVPTFQGIVLTEPVSFNQTQILISDNGVSGEVEFISPQAVPHIVMNQEGMTLSELKQPTNDNDAATKLYVDDSKPLVFELDPFLNRANNSITIDDKFEFDFDTINKQVRWRNVQLFGANYYSLSARYVNTGVSDIQESSFFLSATTVAFNYFTGALDINYNIDGYGCYQRLTVQAELPGEPVYVIKVFGANLLPINGATKVIIKISRYDSTVLT